MFFPVLYRELAPHCLPAEHINEKLGFLFTLDYIYKMNQKLRRVTSQNSASSITVLISHLMHVPFRTETPCGTKIQ